jgi:hypothetical protein
MTTPRTHALDAVGRCADACHTLAMAAQESDSVGPAETLYWLEVAEFHLRNALAAVKAAQEAVL